MDFEVEFGVVVGVLRGREEIESCFRSRRGRGRREEVHFLFFQISVFVNGWKGKWSRGENTGRAL